MKFLNTVFAALVWIGVGVLLGMLLSGYLFTEMATLDGRIFAWWPFVVAAIVSAALVINDRFGQRIKSEVAPPRYWSKRAVGQTVRWALVAFTLGAMFGLSYHFHRVAGRGADPHTPVNEFSLVFALSSLGGMIIFEILLCSLRTRKSVEQLYAEWTGEVDPAANVDEPGDSCDGPDEKGEPRGGDGPDKAGAPANSSTRKRRHNRAAPARHS